MRVLPYRNHRLFVRQTFELKGQRLQRPFLFALRTEIWAEGGAPKPAMTSDRRAMPHPRPAGRRGPATPRVSPTLKRQLRSVQCLEAAGDDTLAQHLPTAHWFGVAVRVECAEIAAIEQIADQTPGGRLDRHGARLRRHLQPHRQVWSIADNAVVLALAGPVEIANDDHSRRYADPAPHRHVGIGSQGLDRRTQFEPRVDRPLGVCSCATG